MLQLRVILFLIESERLYADLEEAVTQLLLETTGSGCAVHALPAAACWERVRAWGIDPQEMLAVTDSPQAARELHDAGAAVAAVRTPENRGEAFAGIAYALEGLFHPGLAYYRKVYARRHGLPWTILETARCLVREIRVEDLDRLYEIYAAPSITRYMENLYEDREEERRYTEDYIRQMYGFFGYGMWIVEEKKSGVIIGRAGLERREGETDAELGYLIAEPYQRQGYGWEVCSAILDYAAEELGMERILCRFAPENAASEHLCRKLGFAPLGMSRDGARLLLIFEKILKKSV